MKTRSEIVKDIETGLALHFSPDTISVEEGYGNNIRVKVVAKKFDGMSDRDAVEYLWDLVGKIGLTDDEKALISLILPVGFRDF